MTEPNNGPGSERPRWVAGRGRALAIAAGVLVIVLVSAALAFLLGGGLNGSGLGATSSPAAAATGSGDTAALPNTSTMAPAMPGNADPFLGTLLALLALAAGGVLVLRGAWARR